MQIVSCPSCGAEVSFKSHAAVMAVCEYCHATVLKSGDSVKDMGKMSSVLEDYSPIQIGTAGVYGNLHFTVVGRIQQRYAQGMWNEWYILFDDGSTAWLGDSSGLYTITIEQQAAPPLPSFDEIRPGQPYSIRGEPFTAAEKRIGECVAGQGELPFRVGEGWRIRVADFRQGMTFLTLDYTDGDLPKVYSGSAVTLPDLKCQLLRDDEAIKSSAGKYRGRLDALDCPSCGSSIKYLPGLATKLVCPACAAQLDAAGPQAQVLAAGEQVEARAISIPLGTGATIDGAKYHVIGAMVRADEEGTEWTEYLLYSAKSSFFWLVESDEGWFRAQVMPNWPQWQAFDGTSAVLNSSRFNKLYDYDATVVWAAGAFNWRVAAGDVVHVYEFEEGTSGLSAELTGEEFTWSRSTPVPFDQIKAWFSHALRGSAMKAGAAASAKPKGRTPVTFIWWLLGLNAIPLLFNFGTTFAWLFVAIMAIYLPGKFFDSGDKK